MSRVILGHFGDVAASHLHWYWQTRTTKR